MSDARGRIAVALLLGASLLGGGSLKADPRRGADPCAGREPALAAAVEAVDQGQWADADRRLRPIYASHADCSGVVLARARLRAAEGDPAEAERLFARAATLAPGDALVHAQAAQHWLSRGQPARADYLSALALSLDPDCPEALVVQGRILSQKGQAPAARRALEKAVDVAPANAEARYQLGIWLYRRQLHPEAVPQFEKVVALRPLDARAKDYLALSLQGLGDAERAELAYRGALKVNEGPFPDAFLDYYYGRFLLKQNRLEESRLHLDRAVALHPNERAVHYERGKLNLALKQYAAARQDAERALALADKGGLVLDLQVYYLLATVYARLGEPELARKYAELSRTTPIPDQAADRP